MLCCLVDTLSASTSSATAGAHAHRPCATWFLLCRRATSEVLQQLRASEVLQEQARFKLWQAACEAWRTLRSRHAVATFCQHIRQDLAEPAERLQLFAKLRDSQQEAHEQLLKFCQRLHQLGPPHLNSQSVGSWVSKAKAWNDGWQQQLSSYFSDLQQQERELEAKVRWTGHQIRLHAGR